MLRAFEVALSVANHRRGRDRGAREIVEACFAREYRLP